MTCYVIRELIPNSIYFISELILLSEDSFCIIVILSKTSFTTALSIYQIIYLDNSLVTVLKLPENQFQIKLNFMRNILQTVHNVI